MLDGTWSTSHTISVNVGSGGGGATTLLSKSNLSGATGSWQHFPVTVPSGKTKLTVTMSGGTGDADLYTRYNAQPTTSNNNCGPYLDGNNETCTHNSPSSGTWYISINGFAAYSGVSLTVTVQ